MKKTGNRPFQGLFCHIAGGAEHWDDAILKNSPNVCILADLCVFSTNYATNILMYFQPIMQPTYATNIHHTSIFKLLVV